PRDGGAAVRAGVYPAHGGQAVPGSRGNLVVASRARGVGNRRAVCRDRLRLLDDDDAVAVDDAFGRFLPVAVGALRDRVGSISGFFGRRLYPPRRGPRRPSPGRAPRDSLSGHGRGGTLPARA